LPIINVSWRSGYQSLHGKGINGGYFCNWTCLFLRQVILSRLKLVFFASSKVRRVRWLPVAKINKIIVEIELNL